MNKSSVDQIVVSWVLISTVSAREKKRRSGFEKVGQRDRKLNI